MISCPRLCRMLGEADEQPSAAPAAAGTKPARPATIREEIEFPAVGSPRATYAFAAAELVLWAASLVAGPPDAAAGPLALLSPLRFHSQGPLGDWLFFLELAVLAVACTRIEARNLTTAPTAAILVLSGLAGGIVATYRGSPQVRTRERGVIGAAPPSSRLALFAAPPADARPGSLGPGPSGGPTRPLHTEQPDPVRGPRQAGRGGWDLRCTAPSCGSRRMIGSRAGPSRLPPAGGPRGRVPAALRCISAGAAPLLRSGPFPRGGSGRAPHRGNGGAAARPRPLPQAGLRIGPGAHASPPGLAGWSDAQSALCRYEKQREPTPAGDREHGSVLRRRFSFRDTRSDNHRAAVVIFTTLQLLALRAAYEAWAAGVVAG